MTHWDGLTSVKSSGHAEQILILGATNRIQHIDEAILRRMPKKFAVPLPSATQRRRILSLVLRDTRLDPDPNRFDLDTIVRVTAGLSGSDIKEACRDAAMLPVRDLVRDKKRRGQRIGVVDVKAVRPLRTDDFFSNKTGSGDITGGVGDRYHVHLRNGAHHPGMMRTDGILSEPEDDDLRRDEPSKTIVGSDGRAGLDDDPVKEEDEKNV